MGRSSLHAPLKHLDTSGPDPRELLSLWAPVYPWKGSLTSQTPECGLGALPGRPSCWPGKLTRVISVGEGGQVASKVARRSGLESLGWEDPLEEQMATHFSGLKWRAPVILPGKVHGQRSLVDYSPCKESNMTTHTLYMFHGSAFHDSQKKHSSWFGFAAPFSVAFRKKPIKSGTKRLWRRIWAAFSAFTPSSAQAPSIRTSLPSSRLTHCSLVPSSTESTQWVRF